MASFDGIHDEIRGSAVNKPVTEPLRENKNNDNGGFKKAQTMGKLTSIKETLRETSEIDSIDKKERERGNQSGLEETINNQANIKEQSLEEVMETESRSLCTETEIISFENSVHHYKNTEF